MTVRNSLERAAGFILDLLYPETAVCRGCGHISDEGCLCAACRKELRETGLASTWEWREVNGVSVYSLRPHEGLARKLVIRLKHQAEACLAEELMSLLQPVPGFLHFSPDTVITWVTMPESRLRTRYIDHGRLLAEAAGRQLNLPVQRLLDRKDQPGKTQARLGRQERERNLKDVFSPAGRICFPVLLVDDVLTTGATISRCTEALRSGGAAEVTALTITYALGE